MVDQPQRNLRNLRRELLDLDPVELIDIDCNQLLDIDETLSCHPLKIKRRTKNFEFQLSQFTVGDYKEIAAATCWIEECKGSPA